MSLVNIIKTVVSGVVDRRDPPPADLYERIALRAYYRAQARGFAPGAEVEDWVAAEAEIKSSIKGY